LKNAEPHPDFYVYRPKDPTEILPWDFIDHGVSRAFLLEEDRAAEAIARGGAAPLSPLVFETAENGL
jgi:hypothetical protein